MSATDYTDDYMDPASYKRSESRNGDEHGPLAQAKQVIESHMTQTTYVNGRAATSTEIVLAREVVRLSALSERGTLPERVWRDTRDVKLDQTMVFSHAYNWDGWECVRKELHTDWGSFAIWPDWLGDKKSYWNVYHDLDGGYKGSLASREEAEKLALKWLADASNDTPAERSSGAAPKSDEGNALFQLKRLPDLDEPAETYISTPREQTDKVGVK